MSVDFQHSDYTNSVKKWALVNDVCDSENLQTYLIKRNPTDESDYNIARNKQIFQRTVFSAIAGYTSRGFVGKIFSKAPKITLPAELEYMNTNADGAGNSLIQQSQDVAKDVTRIGRCGLLVDFPNTEGEELSKADMNTGDIFAPIIKYDASQIINWHTTRVGSKIKLSLVVIETAEDLIGEDGFEFKSVPLIIELRLIESVYHIREWRKDLDKDIWVPGQAYAPTDGAKNTWDEIPFTFVGSESNSHNIDQPPMHDIAKVNIGHFNNSAIYEDSVAIVGQPQPWMSGVDQSHIDMMEKNEMYIGSGRLLPVPAEETFAFAQVAPESMSKEAMDDKVVMMIGLGAMFMTPGSAVKTATQSEGEQLAQHSVLSLISENVSEAYTLCLQWAGKFMSASDNEDDYLYQLNGDFVKPNTDAQTIVAMTAQFLQGAIPMNDYLKWQQKHGFVDPEKTLEEYQEEINTTPMTDLDE